MRDFFFFEILGKKRALYPKKRGGKKGGQFQIKTKFDWGGRKKRFKDFASGKLQGKKKINNPFFFLLLPPEGEILGGFFFFFGFFLRGVCFFFYQKSRPPPQKTFWGFLTKKKKKPLFNRKGWPGGFFARGGKSFFSKKPTPKVGFVKRGAFPWGGPGGKRFNFFQFWQTFFTKLFF